MFFTSLIKFVRNQTQIYQICCIFILMIKLRLYIGIFAWVLLATSINSCSQGKVESGSFNFMLNRILDRNVPEISVDSLEKNFKDFVLLDSRSPNEYSVSHIKCAKHVGYDDFEANQVNHISKSKPIVVYCSVGYRSEKITQKLLKEGYQNVYNLYGGIFEWVNQDQKVYKADQPTRKVHAYSKVWGMWLEKGEKVYD